MSCSYAGLDSGLDVKEYSSGGKEKKFGITKMGNHRIRTTAVESCQKSSAEYRISKRLKADRKGQPQKIIDIADRCMKRLRKKSLRLQYANKHINKSCLCQRVPMFYKGGLQSGSLILTTAQQEELKV